MKRPACRLFVVRATGGTVAAIFRRGPSAWTQVIRWDMSTDDFVDGAWFRGRIYAERCDVSPDGQLLVTFCHQGRKLGTSYRDSWTAVSRLPWLTALALWPAGTTYGGGGRWVGPRTLVLRNGLAERPHPDHLPRGLTVVAGAAPLHASASTVVGADWSGVDHRGRTIYSLEGRLYRAAKGADRELADFADRQPDPTPAPPSARRPL